MFSLICARRNGWVNNGDAGDLRRHCAHYDVTVMEMSSAKFRSFLLRLQWVKAVGIWNSLIQRELMRLLLTHYGIASHMPTKIWVNIGSGNCCLTAPTHYLSRWWFITCRTLCRSAKGNSARNAHSNSKYIVSETPTSEIKANPRGYNKSTWGPNQQEIWSFNEKFGCNDLSLFFVSRWLS